MIWGTPWYPFRKPLNDWETAWLNLRARMDQWNLPESELSPSPSLAFQKRWPTQPEVEVQVSDWGKDACPICASDFHLDRRSAVSCDCGGACQGEGKPGRGMRFTQKYRKSPNCRESGRILDIILLQKRFPWGKNRGLKGWVELINLKLSHLDPLSPFRVGWDTVRQRAIARGSRFTQDPGGSWVRCFSAVPWSKKRPPVKGNSHPPAARITMEINGIEIGSCS